MKKLYAFEAQGFEGRIIADANALANLFGKTIVLEEDDWHNYRLTHTIFETDFKMLSDDPTYLELITHHGLLHGFNPFLAEVDDENLQEVFQNV